MIDSYCVHHTVSIIHLEKVFDMDLMCLIVIKKQNKKRKTNKKVQT